MRRRLNKVAANTDSVQKALVDQGFKSAVVAHGEKVGIEVEIVERNPARTGFVPIPKRWIVERAYGILMLHRRLVRDYEHLPRSSESRVYWAMTAVILRRLTGTTAAAWRST
ncbi:MULTISPECIES: transposase [Streptomyces violaceusniger group]|uniref:Transposase DDE domain-containing protein n=2 Tax=Streptomyces rhizosphaericus TaxID=114699 RepID=A0ABN1S6X3_9ACTN